MFRLDAAVTACHGYVLHCSVLTQDTVVTSVVRSYYALDATSTAAAAGAAALAGALVSYAVRAEANAPTVLLPEIR